MLPAASACAIFASKASIAASCDAGASRTHSKMTERTPNGYRLMRMSNPKSRIGHRRTAASAVSTRAVVSSESK
jgi:hypothetical protein